MAKTTAGGTTRYLVDDLNPTGYAQVVEELEEGVVQRRYAYGLRRITETESVSGSWATHWYGYDGEGHVRALTDATGTVTDTYDYDAFGNVVGSTGTTPNAYRYRGEQWDGDLELYYLRARWYNPVTGRFLSRDPLDTGNKYAYAAADPVNGSDPSGLLTQWTIPAVAGEALYATTVQVIVYGGAAYDAYFIGRYTTVGRDFICILKSAMSAALAVSELEQGYFGLALDAYANGCRVPHLSTPISPAPPSSPTLPSPQPEPEPTPSPQPSAPNGNNPCDPGGEGKSVHRLWNPGADWEKEYDVPGGRIDAVNLRTHTVLELKPCNGGALCKGRSQLRRYIQALEAMFPETTGLWVGRTVCYERNSSGGYDFHYQ